MAELPEWNAFAGGTVPALPEHGDRPGRIVAVVASEASMTDGWAPRAVVLLAEAWSVAGQKVVLADLCLDRPTLHEELGVENGEGVTDAVFFGASVRHVARPVSERSFFFVPSGTVTVDARAVVSSGRWERLGAGFIEAGVTLATFVSAGEAARDQVVAAATDVIAVAGASEALSDLLGSEVSAVLRVTGPGLSEDVPVEADDDEDAVFDPLVQVVDSQEGEGESGVGGDFLLPEEEIAVGAAEEATDGVVRKSSNNRILLVLSLVILAIVGAAAFGLVDIPGISPEGGSDAVATQMDLTPVAHSVPVAGSTPRLAFSVLAGAFSDPDAAAARIAALSRAKGVLFTVAPVAVDGESLYRVLAGPAEDSASAVALAARIGEETGADVSDWVPRETPRAFHLGEMADLDSALRRAEVLRRLDVPTYVLAVDYSDGSTRYRVYAGAYADDEEASYLLSLLESQGLNNATLSDRLGRLPE
jgi:SPOR domain